jgi:tetratricopeptide (TPR) repeat protein
MNSLPFGFRGIILAGVIVILASFSGIPVFAQDKPQDSIPIDGHLHTPQQIIQLIERSCIKYVIDPFVDSNLVKNQKNRKRPNRPPEWYVFLDSNGPVIPSYELSDNTRNLMDSGLLYNNKKEYELALKFFKQINVTNIFQCQVTILIGNSFHYMRQFDSAISFYRKTIELNFIDYEAHRYYGDDLWEIGQKDSALKELTIAHILNINDEGIFEQMKYLREQLGRPWKEWSYEPKYEISVDSTNLNSVKVKAVSPWLGYALAKALWRYEIGYSLKMIGREKDQLIYCPLEEKEALICTLPIMEKDSLPEAEIISQIIDSGFVDEFLLYEVAGPYYPEVIAKLDKKALWRIAEYVDKFH